MKKHGFVSEDRDSNAIYSNFALTTNLNNALDSA